MAPTRRLKRVVASQPGFLHLNSTVDAATLVSSRRKRINKNKKKNWTKYSDINDVEDFLEDVRHQERTTGGLISEKPDDSLFFLDVGQPRTAESTVPEPGEGKKRKGKTSRPLRIDLILQRDSLVPPPIDVLAYQQPNAKKLRRKAQRAEQLAAKGVVTRRQKQLLNRRPVDRAAKKSLTEANNNPGRDFYDIWGQESKPVGDLWYLQQTGKQLVKRPERLNEQPSVLPAVEVIAPGGSYNPDFFSHQALLQEAHDVEVKKHKAEEKIERQLAFDKDDTATEETVFKEQVEGLVEEDDDAEAAEAANEQDHVAVGAITLSEKKTERQRKKEKAEKLKDQRRLAERQQTGQQQQLYQLRSIKSSIRQQEEKTKARRNERKAKQEAQKSQPRRLGRLKFQAPDLEIKLSDELAGSLRQLKPEGSVLSDRFKSLQKRNLIEPRERAKFKRRHKLKYVEKRAFREIT
ncbi:ribosome biogenesis protein NOP53 isoform X1 [Takifugu flavidus]|uniref:Ribosome biogenesis protein NOP53 n=1 Tax=Takifugu flavidus TaxID=433684 RepID=A0A5C6PAA0_9TELE|nr:ribosome biogenesis protein NOP53 isoform X1 [Takifugu flavidus]TWW76714.1 Ribosome biogenesis protein NOP53 [Takifugu flavidus]